MYVDAAAVVGKGARLAKPPNQLLQGFDVLAVGKDGADQFNAVFAGGGELLASVFLLALMLPSLMSFQTRPSGAVTFWVS